MRTALDIHLVLDNYGTHKTPEVKAWLATHPRFHLHFTPTSASWLNLVERFFAEITTKRIRRGVFASVAEPEQAICDYLKVHNADPKPFVWTKSAQAIIMKKRRALRPLTFQYDGNQASVSEVSRAPSNVSGAPRTRCRPEVGSVMVGHGARSIRP